MKLNLNKFLFSISFALDLAENQITTVSKFHSKRVAFISLQMANVLKMSEEEKFDLYAYALMHDNGLIESFTNQKRSGSCNVIVDEDLKEHCEIGEENIRHFPFLTKQENIILYHHERYDGEGFYKKKADEIPLMSQILFFANVLDGAFDLNSITLSTKRTIEEYVKGQECVRFSPRLVKAFMVLSNSFSFWGSLEYFYIVNSPDKLLENFEIDISLDQFYDMIHIFSNIIDAKSKFTAQHSQEVYEKTKLLLDHFDFDDVHKKKILIAANLHDIGKLATPIEILEKEGPLTNDEAFEIKKHAYFTFTILNEINFCNDILNWASHHHEKPDGSGYPFGLDMDDLSIEARLVSCLDFYQALTENRPYRDAVSHKKAIELMIENLKGNQIDIKIVMMIDEVFGNK